MYPSMAIEIHDTRDPNTVYGKLTRVNSNSSSRAIVVAAEL